MRLALALSLALVPVAAPIPAHAQQATLIIYGEDKCPTGNICVVAPEKDRYRIPKPLREPLKAPDSTSWAVRSQATLAEGKTGTDSCSTVGAGGWTGCFMKQMKEYAAENKEEATQGQGYPEPK